MTTESFPLQILQSLILKYKNQSRFDIVRKI